MVLSKDMEEQSEKVLDKKACARCGKKDCEKCVEKEGNFFCCQVCCDEHEKEKAAGRKKEEPVNVCTFC